MHAQHQQWRTQRPRAPLPCSATTTKHAPNSSASVSTHVLSSCDVESAILSAAVAVGQAPTPQAHRELVQTLRDNWYTSAGDVAAMSKEEVQQMRIPVRLWAQLKLMVQEDSSGPLENEEQEAEAEDGGGGWEEEEAEEEGVGAASGPGSGALQDRLSGPGGELWDQQQQQPGQHAAASVFPAVLLPGPGAPEAEGLAGGFLEALPDDIMQRRMPRNLHGTSAMPAASVRTRHSSLRSSEAYGIKEHELTPQLRAELDKFRRFSCERFAGQRVEPLKEVSFKAYLDAIKLMLGWQHRFKDVPLEQLSLKGLLPSAGREAVEPLMEYQHWKEHVRGCNARSAVFPVRACIALARFLYHDVSKPSYYDKLPPYHDLDVVKELARLQRAANLAASKAPLVADEAKKWLQWDEYLGLVRALRAECAGLTAKGVPRAPREVAASLQRYLIFAILSVIPDRQRTLRELEVGRTLVKDEQGRWLICHGPDDYKTGKKYGERPAMVIAPFIYPELEAFIDTWRAELRPTHAQLLCRPTSGEAMTKPNDLRTIFVAAARRLTGRATNPHLVRDMIVTTLRNQGANEGVMDGLALFMGHSVREQRSTYDRRTKAQKVAPAVELLRGLNAECGG